MTKKNQNYRNFLDITQAGSKELKKIIEHAKSLKNNTDEDNKKLLANKQVALIFEKPSTRTRVSFEVGVNQLGGNTIILDTANSQLGRGELMSDTARVMTRYVDLIMIRTFKHETLREMAEHAGIPVINGLTDFSHPCQVMADILTIEEKLGSIEGKTISWVGDFNNMTNSWIHAASALDFNLRISCPQVIAPKSIEHENIKLIHDPYNAVLGSDVVMTDTWISMGDIDIDDKIELFKDYQVNSELMQHAKKEAIFMHCLPAHRGEEVTSDVIDGTQSVVFDQAENRLHVQKSIMLWCLNKI